MGDEGGDRWLMLRFRRSGVASEGRLLFGKGIGDRVLGD
jgi:hypothetical protein